MAFLDPDKAKDHLGAWRTQSLFFELNKTNMDDAVFSLKQYDLIKPNKTYPSLYLLYMQYNDPTEYQFATEVLGSWSHWQKMLNNKQIREKVEEWRAEVEVRMMSDSIKNMVRAGREGVKGIAANKYIMEKGWLKRAGRPSKEEVEREKKVMLKFDKELDEIFEGLGNDKPN